MPFFSSLRFAAATAVALGFVGAAQAQHQHQHTPTPSTVPAATASPIAASIATPANKPLRSIMDGYQRFDADAPLVDWRKANDTVKDIGGWQTYARLSAAEIAKEKIPADADMPPPKVEQKGEKK
jgi:hypothetical protein